jgi:hypothetical protein
MLDNLRNQATFEPEEEEKPEFIQPEQPKPRSSFDKMTGTTDKQRLLLALMLLMIVCLLGVLLLFFSGKWVLPF